jgi:hypothetical protein
VNGRQSFLEHGDGEKRREEGERCARGVEWREEERIKLRAVTGDDCSRAEVKREGIGWVCCVLCAAGGRALAGRVTRLSFAVTEIDFFFFFFLRASHTWWASHSHVPTQREQTKKAGHL